MRQLHKLRYALLLLTAFVCILLWPGVRTALIVDNSLKVWFLEDDPALVPYHIFQDRFGNDEVIILLVKDKNNLLTQNYFDSFIKLTEALETIPEVAGVIGPGNTTIPAQNAFGPSPYPLLSYDIEPAEVSSTLTKMPSLREQLFTPDYKAARFLIVLKNMQDFDSRRGDILEQVEQVIAQHLPAENYYLGGVGIIFAGLNTLSQQDFGFFLGIGYLMMFLLILLIYRSLLILLYALGTVSTATYVTLGIYGTLGFQLNLMSTLLPIIIILLGIMDVLHVLNERNQITGKEQTNLETSLEALRNVLRPCLYTTFTTMAGFLALLVSPMVILQSFGAFAALGIFLSLLFTYLFGVTLLPYTNPSNRSTSTIGLKLELLTGIILNNKGRVTLFTFLLVAGSIAGITRLQSDTYTLGYFPKDHKVVTDHETIDSVWGPYMPLELLVQPKEGLHLHSKEIIQAAMAFTDSAKTLPGVGRIFGFHTLFKAGLESRYQERGEARLQSQFYLTQTHQELSLNYPELKKQFIHDSTQTGRITLSGEMSSAGELTSKMAELLQISDVTLGRVATVTPSGYQPMYAVIVQYVISSQVNSLLLALVLVFLLVWFFIRDIKLTVLAVVPNFFPIALMLGLMGWAGIHLDTATASIAAIVLSFCIDDTIHFIHYYKGQRMAGTSPEDARLKTMQHVGPAIVLTSVILFFGYSLMILGSLKTVELFGLLTATAIVGALYSQLFIFPLLLARFDKAEARKLDPIIK